MIHQMRILFSNSSPFPPTEGLDRIRLIIYDRKTHYVLWTLLSLSDPCAPKSGCDNNFDRAMDVLLYDLEGLSTGSSSTSGA